MRSRQLFRVIILGAGILLGGPPSKTSALVEVGTETEHEGRRNPFSLNVRLSSRSIHPPQNLVREEIPLKGIKAAKPHVGPPPQAAILEDDQRRRVVILSTAENGLITAYVLENIDLKPHLHQISNCVEDRHCVEDRMAITGGLGCVAICIKEIVEEITQP